jgi:16S rRNA (cytidine1402-2'-O)-methyltransferase
MPGTLFVVATPIGNLDDLTGRALRVLRDAALIAAEDTRRTARLLSHYGIGTPTTSLHEHNEERKAIALLARLSRGEDVALVSDAGTPGVSDPGRRLVRGALKAGLTVVPIPGPSAVVTALSASGFPADSFTFLGFPPIRSKDRKQWLADLAAAGRTVVFFEAPHRIRTTLLAIRAAVGDVPLFLARELTKVHETCLIGPVGEVLERLGDPIGEFTGVLKLGRSIEHVTVEPPSDQQLMEEIGHMGKDKTLRKRRLLSDLARKHGLTINQVYAAVERAKKSGE